MFPASTAPIVFATPLSLLVVVVCVVEAVAP
jgi:hypothetical protein